MSAGGGPERIISLMMRSGNSAGNRELTGTDDASPSEHLQAITWSTPGLWEWSARGVDRYTPQSNSVPVSISHAGAVFM
jgi:hypothetical protein